MKIPTKIPIKSQSDPYGNEPLELLDNARSLLLRLPVITAFSYIAFYNEIYKFLSIS